MQVLRTPDERFEGLTDWGFTPRYGEVPDGAGGTLRMHYVEEGPADGPVVLLLHGEPSWAYLYRHVIPPLAAAGARVIAPDLVGMGRSDKPAAFADYSYARHVEWMRALLFDVLDLGEVTVFGQDWGGLIGLRLVAEHPDRFAAVVMGNTGLPTGEQTMPQVWLRFRDYVASAEELPVGWLVNSGCATELSEETRAGYDAPFPTQDLTMAARAFPTLVPHTPDDPARADQERAWASLATFDKPFVCAFSDGDPITAGGDKHLQKVVPGTRGQVHVTITGAGHFLQEDAPDQVAALLQRVLGL